MSLYYFDIYYWRTIKKQKNRNFFLCFLNTAFLYWLRLLWFLSFALKEYHNLGSWYINVSFHYSRICRRNVILQLLSPNVLVKCSEIDLKISLLTPFHIKHPVRVWQLVDASYVCTHTFIGICMILGMCLLIRMVNFILSKNLLLSIWFLIYFSVLVRDRFFTVYICLKKLNFSISHTSYSINISPYKLK